MTDQLQELKDKLDDLVRDTVAKAEALLAEGTAEPQKITEWSDDLRGQWAESAEGEGTVLIYSPASHPLSARAIYWDEGNNIWRTTIVDYVNLTPRPDLARVDLEPRKVEDEVLTTEEGLKALPTHSIVEPSGGNKLDLAIKSPWGGYFFAGEDDPLYDDHLLTRFSTWRVVRRGA